MMKKRMIPLALAFILLLSITAQAATPFSQQGVPRLSFDGTTAYCSVNITEPGSEIKATMTLWNGNRVVDSWSGEATSVLFLSGSCEVREGVEYVLRITGTINGEGFDAVSVRGTC